eukprot:CAMPEP_0197725728 /NCGR_PEP_ID=MMETSP1434-20131217/9962_1 /TAXON_ID=265543 /ORGANISM="Minutocellus polymorphus, Strain CCMP3303" /LENGTH=149 /DNA_ID=CAMNT_0043311353 /DNA_START=113 /DNA_END=558 /DNA_ORIENTATION=-
MNCHRLLSSPLLDGGPARFVPLLLPTADEANGAVALLLDATFGTLAAVIVDAAPIATAGLFRSHHAVAEHTLDVGFVVDNVAFDAVTDGGGGSGAIHRGSDDDQEEKEEGGDVGLHVHSAQQTKSDDLDGLAAAEPLNYRMDRRCTDVG